jgi:uncharacterized protein (TIGR00369 family)
MDQYNNYPVPNPFLSYLGAKFIYANQKECRLELCIDEKLTNSWGNAHGGVLISLMDMSMSWAARFNDENNIMGAATIELKTSFFVPASGNIYVIGSVVHRTATLAFCEATIFNADKSDQIACKSSATFKYSRNLLNKV